MNRPDLNPCPLRLHASGSQQESKQEDKAGGPVLEGVETGEWSALDQDK